jgi:hypothetical protein
VRNSPEKPFGCGCVRVVAGSLLRLRARHAFRLYNSLLNPRLSLLWVHFYYNFMLPGTACQWVLDFYLTDLF